MGLDGPGFAGLYDLLQENGFGVLTEINVKATLKGDDLGFTEVNQKIQMAGPAFNVGLSFAW